MWGEILNKKQVVCIIISVFALLNVVTMPIFEVWGGLFPSDREFWFFDVIVSFFKGYYYYTSWDAWDMWVVKLTVFIFFPSLLMLVFSFVGKKLVFRISALIGLFLESAILVLYTTQEGLEELLDFDDGSVSIGTWIALIVFIIAFVISFSDFESNCCSVLQVQQSAETVVSGVSVSETKTNGCYCSKCGNLLNSDYAYCDNCGFKINRE